MESASITRLLERSRSGDAQAFDELMPFVYAQLKAMAAQYLAGERHAQTLSATALVNEAYVKLSGGDVIGQDRVHFFALAARAMRQILVDHARQRRAQKRGGGSTRVTLDEALMVSDQSMVDVLAVDAVLGELAQMDGRKASLVEMIYFGGLTAGEAAESLGISAPTAFRDLKFAKAWMLQRLKPVAN